MAASPHTHTGVDDVLMVHVRLLDGADSVIAVPRRAKALELFTRVVEPFSLGPDQDYLALALPVSPLAPLAPRQWLSTDEALKDQLPGTRVDLAVRFLPTHPERLQDEMTRHFCLLHLAHEMALGRFAGDDAATTALLLGNLLQVLVGPYDAAVHVGLYAARLGLVPPAAQHGLLAEAQKQHAALGALGIVDAEIDFLLLASAQRWYGFDFFVADRASRKALTPLVLGVSRAGLEEVDEADMPSFSHNAPGFPSETTVLLPWGSIDELKFHGSNFRVLFNDNTRGIQEIDYRCSSKTECFELWRAAVSRHSFYREKSTGKRVSKKPSKGVLHSFKRLLSRRDSRSKAGVTAHTEAELADAASLVSERVLRAGFLRHSLRLRFATDGARGSALHELERGSVLLSTPPSTPALPSEAVEIAPAPLSPDASAGGPLVRVPSTTSIRSVRKLPPTPVRAGPRSAVVVPSASVTPVVAGLAPPPPPSPADVATLVGEEPRTVRGLPPSALSGLNPVVKGSSVTSKIEPETAVKEAEKASLTPEQELEAWQSEIRANYASHTRMRVFALGLFWALVVIVVVSGVAHITGLHKWLIVAEDYIDDFYPAWLWFLK